MIDITDMRRRHANSIRNTATGQALGRALDEIERIRTEAGTLKQQCLDKADLCKQPLAVHVWLWAADVIEHLVQEVQRGSRI